MSSPITKILIIIIIIIRVLKCCATGIASLLQITFTQSMTSGIWSNDWLSANITLKGDRENPSNYRPISLTVICCKIMGHILSWNTYRIIIFHGFRQGHSSETQLISVVEDILYTMHGSPPAGRFSAS